jgi:hypothetical protein
MNGYSDIYQLATHINIVYNHTYKHNLKVLEKYNSEQGIANYGEGIVMMDDREVAMVVGVITDVWEDTAGTATATATQQFAIVYAVVYYYYHYHIIEVFNGELLFLKGESSYYTDIVATFRWIFKEWSISLNVGELHRTIRRYVNKIIMSDEIPFQRIRRGVMGVVV